MIAGGAYPNNWLAGYLASHKHRGFHVDGSMWRSMASRVGIRGRFAFGFVGTRQPSKRFEVEELYKDNTIC